MNARQTAAQLTAAPSSRSEETRDQGLVATVAPVLPRSEQERELLLDLLLSRFNDLIDIMQRHREPRDQASPCLQEVYELDVREELLNVALLGRFITNDLVRLSGSLAAGRGVLCVNAQQIELANLREFAIALILCQTVRRAPANAEPGFVPVPEIIAGAQELLRRANVEGEWRYPGPEDIHRGVNALRRKLRDCCLNPFLIESGQRRQGYRLSTLPWNVQILCD